MSGLAGNSRPSTITVHFAGREARNLLAAAVMSSLVSASTFGLGIVGPFYFTNYSYSSYSSSYSQSMSLIRRTFYEHPNSGYNNSHAARSLPFPRLGSSVGAG